MSSTNAATGEEASKLWRVAPQPSPPPSPRAVESGVYVDGEPEISRTSSLSSNSGSISIGKPHTVFAVKNGEVVKKEGDVEFGGIEEMSLVPEDNAVAEDSHKSHKKRFSTFLHNRSKRRFSWTPSGDPAVARDVRNRHLSMAFVFHASSEVIFDGDDSISQKKRRVDLGHPHLNKHYGKIFIALMAIVNSLGFIVPHTYAQYATWRDSNKDEESPDLQKRFRSFNDANVPPLEAWAFNGDNSLGSGAPFGNFERLGVDAFDPPSPGVNCTAVWFELLEGHLTGLNGLTDPVIARTVLELLELIDIAEVRELPSIAAILAGPIDYRPTLRRATECAETNVPLRAYACSALSDPTLFTRLQGDPAFVVEELTQALHFGLVLEFITAAALEDTGFRAAVHWQMTLIAARIYDRISVQVELTPKDRQYFKDLEKAFKKQKWHSIESATRDHEILKLSGGDAEVAVGLQRNLAMNILEAAHLELVDGVPSNVELGLAIAVGAQGPLPLAPATSGQPNQLWWPLGKTWADAYVAWNFEYVSHFETVHHPVKLLIPSILCLDKRAGHFIDARTFSLKLFQVYYVNRRDRNFRLYGTGSRGNGVWNATLTERRRMSELFLKHSRLPQPSKTKFGAGSLQLLFDQLKPKQGWLDYLTAFMHYEWFLFYSTVVVWLTVILAGFGSEVVLGEHLIKNMAGDHHEDHEWTSVAWHAAQLAFSLFLTVALFEHSAIGLPFLVLGLWKLGFPETVCCFLGSFAQGPTLEGFCLFLDGTGFVLHHTTTAFTIVSLTTGLFPSSQQIIACCVIPVMQHWFVLLRYHSRLLYTVVELGLEVVFQIEVLSYVSYFVTPWGKTFDCIGRGCALTMLLSHWVWFASSCIRKIDPLKALCFTIQAVEELGEEVKEGVEKAAEGIGDAVEQNKRKLLKRNSTLTAWRMQIRQSQRSG